MKKTLKSATLVFAFLAPLFLLENPVQAQAWTVETVESAGDVGKNPAIAVDAGGNAYISYFKETDHELVWFATNRSGSWSRVSSFSGSPVWGPESDIVLDGSNVHICYYFERGTAFSLFRELRLWTRNLESNANTHTVIDEGGAGGATPHVGRYCNLALDSAGGLHVSYWNETGKGIRYRHRPAGGEWGEISQIGNTTKQTGPWNSLVVTTDGIAHRAYYYDRTVFGGTETFQQLLKIRGIRDGSLLPAENIDGAPGDADPDVGKYNRLVVDSTGRLHACYYETGEVGGVPYGKFKYAWKNSDSGSWERLDLTPVEGWGETCSITVGGTPEKVHISFTITTSPRVLFYASRAVGSSEALTFDEVVRQDPAGDNIFPSSNAIAVDQEGGIHIAFYDATSDNLMYAHKAPPAPPAGPVCGNGTCDAGETAESCPADCGGGGPVCGDRTCDTGETCSTCEADCGACAGPFCGDGTCNEATETEASCPRDCAMPRCPAVPCPGGTTCDVTEGVCVRVDTVPAVRACVTDADCGAGNVCRNGECVVIVIQRQEVEVPAPDARGGGCSLIR